MEAHDRIKQARTAAGYSRAADAIEAFGFSKFTYYQHENGTQPPSKAAFERYAKAYRVSLEWLITGAGDMKPVTADPETAQVVDIFVRILDPARRRAALDMLESLADKKDNAS